MHHLRGREPKSLQAINTVFVDDLLGAWNEGIRVWDAAEEEWFDCKVMVLQLIADYPGV